MSTLCTAALLLTPLAAFTPAHVAGDGPDWKTGKPELASAGALAFGNEGVLFVGDPEGAAIFALKVGETKAPAEPRVLDLENVDDVLAFLVGTTRDEIAIHDLAVDPIGGAAFLSCTRGKGDAAAPMLVKVGGADQVEVLELDQVQYLRAALDNAPAPDSGRRSKRTQSITDLAFHDGILYVAGLSNEEFASKLRALEFPFEQAGDGTSVEIYHASHGAWETRSPVRALIPIDLEGIPYLLCGYTCTPLVKVPVSEIAGGEKFVGTTVAELGNRNTPLDMVIYDKGGERFLLIANTSRGVMKLSTKGLDGVEGLTEPVREAAGVGYETIEALQNVTQLASIDGKRGLVLVETESGASLATIELP